MIRMTRTTFATHPVCRKNLTISTAGIVFDSAEKPSHTHTKGDLEHTARIGLI